MKLAPDAQEELAGESGEAAEVKVGAVPGVTARPGEAHEKK
jgi:hypothetical protein